MTMGVLVVLVDGKALLPLKWGDVEGFSRLIVSPRITISGT